MPARRALTVRERNRQLVTACLRARRRPQPHREPLYRLWAHPRTGQHSVPEPVEAPARNGHACSRASVPLDRLGLGRLVGRVDEGLHALFLDRPLELTERPLRRDVERRQLDRHELANSLRREQRSRSAVPRSAVVQLPAFTGVMMCSHSDDRYGVRTGTSKMNGRFPSERGDPLHHLAVRQHLRAADVVARAERASWPADTCEVRDDVRERDWLRTRGHPARGHHRGQPVDERDDRLERCTATAHDHRRTQRRHRDGCGRQARHRSRDGCAGAARARRSRRRGRRGRRAASPRRARPPRGRLGGQKVLLFEVGAAERVDEVIRDVCIPRAHVQRNRGRSHPPVFQVTPAVAACCSLRDTATTSCVPCQLVDAADGRPSPRRRRRRLSPAGLPVTPLLK